MSRKQTYRMSFTVGGLFSLEALKAAELYLKTKDWGKVRTSLVGENLLQLRTESSRERISRELCDRLGCLRENEIEFLLEGSDQERDSLLWIAVCRHYRFIYEFVAEVLRPRFLTYQRELLTSDFDAFFNAKAAWHEELDEVTASTQAKLRQVFFRILRESGLIDSKNVLQPTVVTPRLVQMISRCTPADLTVFFISDADLKEILK